MFHFYQIHCLNGKFKELKANDPTLNCCKLQDRFPFLLKALGANGVGPFPFQAQLNTYPTSFKTNAMQFAQT
jgi:hypothetical protein